MTNNEIFPDASEQIEFFIKILDELLNQEIHIKEVYVPSIPNNLFSA